MKCCFCKKEKVLCKAHLIPESFFRFMYPSGKVEGDSIIMVSGDKSFVSKKRIGFYDNTILCSECDGIIGKKYDEYGKKIFLDTEPQLIKSIEIGDVFEFKKIISAQLKLFIISMLWRFSISNLPEFSPYKLPEKFVNQLYNRVLNSDPGDINDFSIVISRFSYTDNIENLKKYLQLPVPARINGINYLNIYLPNGYKILIKIDSRPQTQELLPLTIDVNKPVYVIVWEQFEKTKEFLNLIENSHKIKRR